jgi:hypothetical protein
MSWVLDLAAELRAEIVADPFHVALAAGELDKFLWIGQLRYQAEGFIRALFWRAANATSENFDTAAEHAVEEGRHPTELSEWVRAAGIVDASPVTKQTRACVEYCVRVAMSGDFARQVLVLNVVSEGVSLDFFRAAIPRVHAAGYPVHRYWRTHAAIDAEHMRLGLDAVPLAYPGTPLGDEYIRVIRHAAQLYREMLRSWHNVEA